jgi:FlgD Ig-like domain
MRQLSPLLLFLVFAVTVNAFAKETESLTCRHNLGNLVDEVAPLETLFSRAVGDTIFFGGDDGNGVAFEGGIWDFDTIVTDPLQGFTSRDKTINPGDYFSRVTAADFSSDPCVPIFPGSTGQLWVGIHEEEAIVRDFAGGMGYQNLMCQNAFSPFFEHPGETIQIEFSYFNDTELDYDFTSVYLACYDSAYEPLEGENAEYLVERFTGVIGSYETPVLYQTSVDAGLLPLETEHVKLLLRMKSDKGFSDEDGDYETPCGPFACDDITFSTGEGFEQSYDFESTTQGWTFSRCPGVGTFLGVVDAATYEPWIDELDLLCYCSLAGNALECVDEENSPFSPPGHPRGHNEELITGAVPRGSYQPPEYNTVLCFYTEFLYLTLDRGTFYRPGYMTYPYTTEINPIPHWSPRKGQNTWHYAGDAAVCIESGYNMSTIGGNAGDPMPVEWDSCKFVYEIICDAAAFGLDPTPDEGNTRGTPLLDNITIGLTTTANAPVISYYGVGQSFHDGFGHNYPTYLEPHDRGNSNITIDYSGHNDPTSNDWLGDTAVVAGPSVPPGDVLAQWRVYLCFKLTHVGPAQADVPEYHSWKARLNGDPEQGFVCVLMDSLETPSGPHNDKYATYFHEDEPGYNSMAGDLSEENEILPDNVFTPGTAVEYYYRSEWINIPHSDSYIFPATHAEFEILPRMRSAANTDYPITWPSVLYIDAYNRGAEYYVEPTLTALGLEFDRYDHLDASCCWFAAMRRSHAAGAWGNNGFTPEQLLGYRLVFMNTGTFGIGALDKADWSLFLDWLNSTDCNTPNTRRGIIFDGDQIPAIMNQMEHQPEGGDFLNYMLGATTTPESYREYADDLNYCVYLHGTGAAFEPDAAISLYGNACPLTFDYNVLGIQSGVSGVQGNLVYFNDDIGETEFAQVVRSKTEYPYNWRSIINTFSLHHLSQVGCEGENCATDSACVVNAAIDLYGPALNWILEGSDPFEPWSNPCLQGVEDDPVNHSPLKVNFLRGISPNPFRSTATIRFNLAYPGEVDFRIYDVSGRLITSVQTGNLEAGENSISWDGTDTTGNRVSGGIFWIQMNTSDGFISGKKMIVLR